MTEEIGEDNCVVTYVSRGLEAMRGFDIFVRASNRISAVMPNVLFVVVGSDRSHYGNDLRHIKARSFREHVLQTERPDLTRFRVLGTVPASELVEILSLSDLHIYLTVPFVIWWSLLNAFAFECTVPVSDTAPVREVIEMNKMGLLAVFFDVEALAADALRVVEDRSAFRPLAAARSAMMEERYTFDRTLRQLWRLSSQSSKRLGCDSGLLLSILSASNRATLALAIGYAIFLQKNP